MQFSWRNNGGLNKNRPPRRPTCKIVRNCRGIKQCGCLDKYNPPLQPRCTRCTSTKPLLTEPLLTTPLLADHSVLTANPAYRTAVDGEPLLTATHAHGTLTQICVICCLPTLFSTDNDALRRLYHVLIYKRLPSMLPSILLK